MSEQQDHREPAPNGATAPKPKKGRGPTIALAVVLTAEQQYQDAALSQVQADAQRFTDITTLFRALGSGWWNTPQDPSLLPVARARTSDDNHRVAAAQ